MELHVPASLAGVAIAEPLHLDPEIDGKKIYYTELTRIYTMLGLTYVLELVLIYALWCVDAADPECSPNLLRVQSVCVFIFMTAVFSDLLHDIDLLLVLYYAEPEIMVGSPRDNPVTVKKDGAILEDDRPHDEEEKDNHSFMDLAMLKFRKRPPQGTPCWSLRKITYRHKQICTAVVAVPKIVIRIALAFFGATYIVQSKSIDTLVLNTLAVNFVGDVGDLLYSTFIPQGTKTALENMEAIIIPLTNTQRFNKWVLSSVVYPLIVLMLTCYIVVIQAGCAPSGPFHILRIYLGASEHDDDDDDHGHMPHLEHLPGSL